MISAKLNNVFNDELGLFFPSKYWPIFNQKTAKRDGHLADLLHKIKQEMSEKNKLKRFTLDLSKSQAF